MAYKAVWLIKKNPSLTHEEYCAAHAGHAPTLMPYIGHLVSDYALVFSDFENAEQDAAWNGASIMTFPSREAFLEVGKVLSDPANVEKTGEHKEDFIDHTSVLSFFAEDIDDYDVSAYGAAENPEFADEGGEFGAVWFSNGLPGFEGEAFHEAFDGHVKLVLGHLGSTVSGYKLTWPSRTVDSNRQDVPVAYGCITEMAWPSRKAFDLCGQMAEQPEVGSVIHEDELRFIDLPGVITLTGRRVKIA